MPKENETCKMLDTIIGIAERLDYIERALADIYNRLGLGETVKKDILQEGKYDRD